MVMRPDAMNPLCEFYSSPATLPIRQVKMMFLYLCHKFCLWRNVQR